MLLYFLENSTLNIFHASPDGKRFFMSTSTENLPAPVFGISDAYPKKRTSKIYNVDVCLHEFVYNGMRQIRRNDEAPTTFYVCKHCNFSKTQ